MKIRNGFVSNSSSSSFVVALPRVPQSKDELKEMLFPGRTDFCHPYDDTKFWPISMAVDVIWECIANQTPNNFDKIVEAFNGWYDGVPDMDDFKINENTWNWEAWEEVDKAKRIELATTFIKSNPTSIIYSFELSDNGDELDGELEHGNTFYNVPHEVIGRH